MDIERYRSVEQRAALHAALSDPARLRIVDLLTLGDRSPSELQAELRMPSNLMAHHLRTLEAAGMIARHRSEGDRRRSYLRLNRNGMPGLVPDAHATVHRVVFVCTANSARSQMAESLWRETSSIPVASAGTHPAATIASGAIAVLERENLAVVDREPKNVRDVLTEGDLTITVCDNAYEELGATGLHWSVPDPVRVGTRRAFRSAFDELGERIRDLAPRLIPV